MGIYGHLWALLRNPSSPSHVRRYVRRTSGHTPDGQLSGTVLYSTVLYSPVGPSWIKWGVLLAAASSPSLDGDDT